MASSQGIDRTNVLSRQRRIYIVDDDAKIVIDAMNALFSYQSPDTERYSFVELDLYQMMDTEVDPELDYWHSLDIESDDTVVLDFHYEKFKDPTSQKPVALAYNGGTIVDLIVKQKERGFLQGLERVVIWTSDEKVISTESNKRYPTFSLADGFDVYGVHKGRNLKGETIDPAQGLVEHLEAIYADPRQNKIKPLNYGWREEGIQQLIKREDL